MKRITTLFLLLVLVLFGSCRDESDHVSFFTLRVDDSYAFFDELDFWVFANDLDGNVLDAQPFHAGDVISLRSEQQVEVFNLSIFVKAINGGKDHYNVQTFFGVSRNTEMERSHADFNPRGSAGVATITITNYLESSIPKYSLYYSDGFQLAGTSNTTISDTYENNTFTMNVVLQEGAPELFISGYRGGIPVYENALNLSAGQSRVLDFNSFKEFDHTIHLDEDAVGAIYGYREIGSETAEFVLSSTDYIYATGNYPPVIGYNDGYDNYLSVFRRFENGSNVEYAKKGSVNPDFTLPAYTFNITNQDPFDFEMEFSRPYTYLSAVWSADLGSHSVSWSARAKTVEEIKPVTLPEALTDLFPQMSYAGLQYDHCEITECLDGYTYDQYILQLDQSARPSYERYSYSNYQ